MNMGVRILVLATILCVISVFVVQAADLDYFEGLWVALYPEQPFESETAEYLSVYVIDGTVLRIRTSMRLTGSAGPIQYEDGVLKFTDRFGTTEYQIDESIPDEMIRVGVSGSRQNDPVVRYVRFRPEFLQVYEK